MSSGEEIKLSDYLKETKSTGNCKYNFVYSQLRKHAIDPVYFDFTQRQMTYNKIIKVFIPELAPPYLHSKPFYGHRRYYELPYKLGYQSKKLTYESLNKKALPYP